MKASLRAPPSRQEACDGSGDGSWSPRILPDLPQARTPRPPQTPLPLRPLSSRLSGSSPRPLFGSSPRPLSARAPSSLYDHSPPSQRPVPPSGRSMRLSRLQRPASAGAVPMPPHAPRREELERKAQLCVSPGPRTVQTCGSRFGGKGSPAEEADAVVNVLRKEAWDLVEGEKYETAIGKLSAAIEMQPSNAALFASRAYARLELGLVEGAVEDCETAISIAPDDVNGYLRMASMCATVGKHSRAIGKLRLGLERFPGHEELTKVLKELEAQESSEQFERSCEGSATDSLGPYLDVAAGAVEEAVDAAAHQAVAMQEDLGQHVFPVDPGLGADEEEVQMDIRVDLAAAQLQSAEAKQEGASEQDGEGRSVPLEMQAQQHQLEERGERGEYDVQGEAQILSLCEESDNDSCPMPPPLPADDDDEGSRPPTPYEGSRPSTPPVRLDASEKNGTMPPPLPADDDDEGSRPPTPSRPSTHPVRLDASEKNGMNSSRAGSAKSTRSRTSVKMVRLASNSTSTLLVPVMLSADAHDQEETEQSERSCEGSATDSLGPYSDVAAEAVEETVEAAAQAVETRDAQAVEARDAAAQESQEMFANDTAAKPSEDVASSEPAQSVKDGAVDMAHQPVAMQGDLGQHVFPVDPGLGADEEEVQMDIRVDLAAAQLQSVEAKQEGASEQDGEGRSVPLEMQAQQHRPEGQGARGEYDIETFEDDGDGKGGRGGGAHQEEENGEVYSDDADVANEASQPNIQDADEYTDDEFEDVHEVEGELKEAHARQVRLQGHEKDPAVQSETKVGSPDYENEEYDDFGDDAAQSTLNPNIKEYASDYCSDTDVESRGNTAFSGATTLPRTRRGTQPGSRVRTGGSDLSSASVSTCTFPPHRSYLDSVDGQLIRGPGFREIQWELPKGEQELEEWPLISSFYPASGVSAFPSVDTLLIPEKVVASDEAFQQGSPARNSREQKPKDKLDPQYRKRINLFLGINEWPPPPVRLPTPPAPPVTHFVAKWYEILSSGLHSRYLKWTRQGTAFVLQDPLGFQSFVLPTYFKPATKTRSGIGSIDGYNFPRVIKALRDHGFTRVDPNDTDSLEFWHRFFVAGAPENLHMIKFQNKRALIGGELELVLPRPWTPCPMPGDNVPLNHPFHHMTCPESAPLPHGAEYSRSYIFEDVARPGTTATRPLPKIKVLEKHHAEVKAALRADNNKGKLANLFSNVVRDVHATKVNAEAAKRVKQVKTGKVKLEAVKKEEVLVGPDLFPAIVGMRVKLSTAGQENKELSYDAHLDIGMIMEIEPDGRLCQVKWQTGEEEWCCTGFSNKYYLQAFIIAKEDGAANSELWLKAAKFSPKWDLLDGVWKMNRLKSRVKMSTHSLRQEASQDKLLKGIREEVRKYHVKLRAEEMRRLEAEKTAKKQQKQKKGKTRIMSVVDQGAPKIDNIEYVGIFKKKWGTLAAVIEQGQLINLNLVLRNAFNDMDKLPSGHVALEHLKLQFRSMGLGKDAKTISLATSVHVARDFATFDEFLDVMYCIFGAPDKRPEYERRSTMKRTASFLKRTPSINRRFSDSEGGGQSPLGRTPSDASCASSVQGAQSPIAAIA